MTILFRDAGGASLAPRGSIVSIGAFDGIHRGHQTLLRRARERARERGVLSIAVSFEPLPRQFFQGRDQVLRLTSPRQRIALLSALADRVGLLRFDRRLAETEAEDFVRDVLVARCGACEVWVGPGFRFGRGRRGDAALLERMGAGYGFTVREIEPVSAGDERISSSRIRQELGHGRFALVESLLGRPFTMSGHVVRGRQLGRKLGYPTANLRIRYGRAPIHGILAVRVSGEGLERWPAVASLGTRPTVDGKELLLEAHLFDFDGDLYGKLLEVEFVEKLRDEIKFDGLDALVAQMHRDAASARAILAAAASIAGAA
jgi:riboflavin kinase/FMN adenylyltransferase